LKQITISDEHWDRLQALAEPLVDSIDDFLDRLLESAPIGGMASENQKSKRPAMKSPNHVRADYGRIPRGLRLKVEAFERPILLAIKELGGRARAVRVLPIVERQLKTRLNDVDYESLTSGGPRWHKTARWAKFALAEKGLVGRSEHGWWKFSPKGNTTAGARSGN